MMERPGAIARVLYIANAAQIGGGNRVLLQLCAGMRARGITPFVTIPEPGPMLERCAELGVECTVMPYIQPSWRSPARSWSNTRLWRALLRRVRPDIAHANDPRSARIVMLACRLEGIKVICHVHFAPAADSIGWLFSMLPKPAAFLFCSHAMRSEVGRALAEHAPRVPQLVIHNCVPPLHVEPRIEAESPSAKIGIVANLIPVKGHHDFLSMARVLADRGVPARYLIVGEDIYRTGYRAELENRAHELGLDDCVKFLGHCADVPSMLAQMDVVVCTSHVEPFGMCVLEAIACGKAVVATTVGGIPEIIEHETHGILVPPHAPEQLADAVEKLIKTPALRKRYGDAGRLRATNVFSQDNYVESMLAVYRETVAPPGHDTLQTPRSLEQL